MQIKIKEINGDEFVITAEPQETVAVLKSKIEAERKISVMEMKLLFSGKVLQDEKTLEDYKISDSCKIMLTRVKVDLKSLIQKVLSKYYDSENGKLKIFRVDNASYSWMLTGSGYGKVNLVIASNGLDQHSRFKWI